MTDVESSDYVALEEGAALIENEPDFFEVVINGQNLLLWVEHSGLVVTHRDSKVPLFEYPYLQIKAWRYSRVDMELHIDVDRSLDRKHPDTHWVTIHVKRNIDALEDEMLHEIHELMRRLHPEKEHHMDPIVPRSVHHKDFDVIDQDSKHGSRSSGHHHHNHGDAPRPNVDEYEPLS